MVCQWPCDPIIDHRREGGGNTNFIKCRKVFVLVRVFGQDILEDPYDDDHNVPDDEFCRDDLEEGRDEDVDVLDYMHGQDILEDANDEGSRFLTMRLAGMTLKKPAIFWIT